MLLDWPIFFLKAWGFFSRHFNRINSKMEHWPWRKNVSHGSWFNGRWGGPCDGCSNLRFCCVEAVKVRLDRLSFTTSLVASYDRLKPIHICEHSMPDHVLARMQKYIHTYCSCTYVWSYIEYEEDTIRERPGT